MVTRRAYKEVLGKDQLAHLTRRLRAGRSSVCKKSMGDAGYRLWDNVTGIDEKGQRRLGTG